MKGIRGFVWLGVALLGAAGAVAWWLGWAPSPVSETFALEPLPNPADAYVPLIQQRFRLEETEARRRRGYARASKPNLSLPNMPGLPGEGAWDASRRANLEPDRGARGDSADPIGSAAEAKGRRSERALVSARPGGFDDLIDDAYAGGRPGVLTEDDFKDAIRAWDAPKRCRFKLKEGAPGTVTLKMTFIIDPSGKVSGTRVREVDSFREERFAECLQSRYSSLRFPELEGRVVQEATFVF